MFIKPHIISNFLTDEEILELRNLIEENRYKDYAIYGPNAPILHAKLSRISIQFQLTPRLTKKFEDLAKFLTQTDVAVTHYNYLEYDHKYNGIDSLDKYHESDREKLEKKEMVIPNLPPHLDMDNVNNEVTLDYQLASNVDWAVVVEDEKFIMKNNDVLVFNGGKQIHWRENIEIKPGQFCEMVGFHYSRIDNNWKFSTNLDPVTKEEKQMILDHQMSTPKMKKYWESYHKERKQFLKEKGFDKK